MGKLSYITNWLYSEKADTLSPGSFDGYERAINVRIRDFEPYDLWNKQLTQIDHDAKTGIEIFKCYVEALRDSGYARKTISEITGIISQCLKYASSPLRRDLKYNYMQKLSVLQTDKYSFIVMRGCDSLSFIYN